MPRRLTAILTLAGFTVLAAPAQAGSSGQDFTQIERGRYLTIAGDCAGCHTADGRSAFAGGRPIATPFGKVIATNITPDRATGIGDWSDNDFVRALREGIRRDGAHLYPAMPYPYFTKMTRTDVLAIRAYLTTVPAVQHSVQADQLPFPLSVREEMAAWNTLYFAPGTYRPVAGKSDEWNRGAYLVEGLMHCGACHTPKNVAGADKVDERLQGSPVQGWFAPDITNAERRGLGRWSIHDVVAYLKTGHNQSAAATGPMAEEVAKSSSKMTDTDLRAVAVYLKQQPGPDEKSPKPIAGDDPAMKTGAAIYRDECSACHAPTGAGAPGLFPKLAGAPAVQSVDPTSLIRVVLSGTRSVATDAAPTAAAMPAFAWILNDGDAAAVLTYIRNSWGNAASGVTAAMIGTKRKSLEKSSD